MTFFPSLLNGSCNLTYLLCGEAYDVAGAMAGKSRGVASCIISKFPVALYTHFSGHRLNLCVMKCCSIQEVNNKVQTADKISSFFSSSPERQLSLEKWLDSEEIERS